MNEPSSSVEPFRFQRYRRWISEGLVLALMVTGYFGLRHWMAPVRAYMSLPALLSSDKGAVLLREGRQFEEYKDFRWAAYKYMASYRLDPYNAAIYWLADLAAKSPEAMRILEQEVQANPNDKELSSAYLHAQSGKLRREGQTLEKQGRFLPSAEKYLAAYQKDKDGVALAWMESVAVISPEAMAFLERTAQENPRDTDIVRWYAHAQGEKLRQEGHDLEREGRFLPAAEKYLAAYQKDKDGVALAWMKSVAVISPEAMAFLERTAQENPADAEIANWYANTQSEKLYKEGLALEKQGLFLPAAEKYLASYRKCSSDGMAVFCLGELAVDSPQVTQFLEQELQAKPDQALQQKLEKVRKYWSEQKNGRGAVHWKVIQGRLMRTA